MLGLRQKLLGKSGLNLAKQALKISPFDISNYNMIKEIFIYIYMITWPTCK